MSTKFLQTVTVVCQPLADQQSVSQSIPGLYDLDVAVGEQLDVVGQWIGVSRYLLVPISGVFFSFDTSGLGFDQGVWDGFQPSGAGVLTALPDTQYRLLLYATVAANHWDGTVPGALALLNAFWNPLGYTIRIIDGQDMTMSFVLTGTVTPSPLTLALYEGGYLDVRPAGVLVANHYINTTPGPVFGFDMETSAIAGFDVGNWM
jgi:hypothetical protein